MTIDELRDLNFKRVLMYEGVPKPKRKTGNRLYQCHGFCVKCERCRLVSSPVGEVLMSHGCLSSDFESLLGPMPDKRLFEPIMFLFQNPGGNYGNCSEVSYEGITKWPPVNHYYWTPTLSTWPKNVEEIKVSYGDYIAYLMVRFGFANVYITNCIKCKYTKMNYWPTAEKCINEFLVEEVNLFKPKMILCFGTAADKLIYKYLGIGGGRKARLLHPRVLDDPRQRKKYPQPEDYYNENERRIEECLKRNGLIT